MIEPPIRYLLPMIEAFPRALRDPDKPSRGVLVAFTDMIGCEMPAAALRAWSQLILAANPLPKNQRRRSVRFAPFRSEKKSGELP